VKATKLIVMRAVSQYHPLLPTSVTSYRYRKPIMSTGPTTLFQVTKGLSIIFTGIGAGFVLAYPFAVETLFSGVLIAPPSETGPSLKLTPSQRLALWHSAYHSGAVFMPPVALAASAALVVTGHLSPSGIGSALEVGSKGWYWLTALITISFVAFTLLFIRPLNDRLIATRDLTSLDAYTSTGDVGVMDKRLESWNKLHGVRVLIFLTAFVMAVLPVVQIF